MSDGSLVERFINLKNSTSYFIFCFTDDVFHPGHEIEHLKYITEISKNISQVPVIVLKWSEYQQNNIAEANICTPLEVLVMEGSKVKMRKHSPSYRAVLEMFNYILCFYDVTLRHYYKQKVPFKGKSGKLKKSKKIVVVNSETDFDEFEEEEDDESTSEEKRKKREKYDQMVFTRKKNQTLNLAKILTSSLLPGCSHNLSIPDVPPHLSSTATALNQDIIDNTEPENSENIKYVLKYTIKSKGPGGKGNNPFLVYNMPCELHITSSHLLDVSNSNSILKLPPIKKSNIGSRTETSTTTSISTQNTSKVSEKSTETSSDKPRKSTLCSYSMKVCSRYGVAIFSRKDEQTKPILNQSYNISRRREKEKASHKEHTQTSSSLRVSQLENVRRHGIIDKSTASRTVPYETCIKISPTSSKSLSIKETHHSQHKQNSHTSSKVKEIQKQSPSTSVSVKRKVQIPESCSSITSSQLTPAAKKICVNPNIRAEKSYSQPSSSITLTSYKPRIVQPTVTNKSSQCYTLKPYGSNVEKTPRPLLPRSLGVINIRSPSSTVIRQHIPVVTQQTGFIRAKSNEAVLFQRRQRMLSSADMVSHY